MFNNNLQYILAEGEVIVWMWAHWEEEEADENGCQCYKIQGLCTVMFGKEETVQMHQLEK